MNQTVPHECITRSEFYTTLRNNKYSTVKYFGFRKIYYISDNQN
jgi:hypothetical protein